MIYKITNTNYTADLFDGWEETLIWSCLQGVMGAVYGDDPVHPNSAAAVIGDFTFFAGAPLRELAEFSPASCKTDFRILVPDGDEWKALLMKTYGPQARLIWRYALKKEPDVFDISSLTQAVSQLSPAYVLRLIDKALYEQCKSESWSSDLVAQFPTWESFKALGLGVVILKDGVIVSGASSYGRYLSGIEIEVDTREDFRRKGLAYLCSARLILECQKRGLYPSWDAHNMESVALAEKLGYHFSHPYEAIEVTASV